jgi:GNAT superfamily N-acetyltransferase
LIEEGGLLEYRKATVDDAEAIQTLIQLSARYLSDGFYTSEQVEQLCKYVFKLDIQLILDGTYFVALKGNALVGCGGWGKRLTIYGPSKAEDPLLNPPDDAGKIRSMFVHPDYARQGIAKSLLALSLEDSLNLGFTHWELVATLPGVPFYRSQGFKTLESFTSSSPEGIEFEFVQMKREQKNG